MRQLRLREDSEEEDAAVGGPVIIEDEASSSQKSPRVDCTDRLRVARGQLVVQHALHGGALVGSLATVAGQLSSLGVSQLSVLVASEEEDLVRLGRVDEVVSHRNPDDCDLAPMSALVRLDGVDPCRHDRVGVVQRHLLEVVEELRRHTVDHAVGPADDEQAGVRSIGPALARRCGVGFVAAAGAQSGRSGGVET